MSQTQWTLADPLPSHRLHRYGGLSPILAQILHNRGFHDPGMAERFLGAATPDEDPFDMADMRQAVERIKRGIAAGEPMAVYGDFDADGVTATALMMETLAALGARAHPYIPDRVTEGYGLHAPALQKLAEQGVSLVITVDCGIRSNAEVAAARKQGLDIVISDHHSLGPELPAATAVINPQREPQKSATALAGAGVAFMLAKALLLDRWQNDRDRYPEGLRLSSLLDLVALGTVADIVPLNDSQNRWLVRQGLSVINAGRRPGLAALAEVTGLRAGQIKATDIGFGLGPRINAAGRLGSAMIAYRLLTSASRREALPLAQDLQALNLRRQQLTSEALAAISQPFEDVETPALIFAGGDNIHPGIVGLVAGKLCERHYRPAIVLEIGPEQSRASCRSIPEFNIAAALDDCSDLLIRHGGHAMAAGFTVHNSNVDMLQLRLNEAAASKLDGKPLMPRLPIDLELDPRGLSPQLVEELAQLEPTGHRHPPASFLSRGLRVLQRRRIGQDGKHLRLRFARHQQPPLDAIGFGMGERARQLPRRLDAVYHIELNDWHGRRSLQMRLLDIRAAGA